MKARVTIRGLVPIELGKMRSPVWAGLAYVGVLFGIGFVFGIVRELGARRGVSRLAMEVGELPVMIALSALVCSRLARRVSPAFPARAAMGGVALVVLIGLEMAVAFGLRRWSWSQYLGHFQTTRGVLSLVGYGAFAGMPWVLAWYSGRPRSRSRP